MYMNLSPENFGDDEAFLRSNQIEIVVLSDKTGLSKIIVAPGLQGRVMTSTASGDEGYSFGWINYELFRSKTPQKQIYAFGGEERIWLGPEGGPFSFYFGPEDQQIFENWKVPAEIDTIGFKVYKAMPNEIHCGNRFELINASGNKFDIELMRKIRILELPEIQKIVKIKSNESLRVVAYETQNTIINRGVNEWNETVGAPSVWMLSMLRPTDNTNIYLPLKKTVKQIKQVNDNYFGKIPSSRLIVEDGMAILKADGKSRGKIGIGYENAGNYAISNSFDINTLTLLQYSLPDKTAKYVNSQWGNQNNMFNGDVVNAYNDGPLEDGAQLGPFYELESSSPAAFLKPGEKLTHVQRTFHFEGNQTDMTNIFQKILI